MKIYELNKYIEELEQRMEQYAIENDGDITDFEFSDKLDELKEHKEDRLINLALWTKNLDAEAEAMEAEIEKLKIRKSPIKNKSERIKSFIDSQVDKDKKITDPRVIISKRKSDSVSIDGKVPKRFLEKEIILKPDKKEIKKFLKTKKAKWAHIETNYNLQIK